LVARVAFTTTDDARPRLRIAPFSRVTALDARRARASPPIRAAAEIVRIIDVDVEHPPVIPLVALSFVRVSYPSRSIDRAHPSSSTSSSRRPLPSSVVDVLVERIDRSNDRSRSIHSFKAVPRRTRLSHLSRPFSMVSIDRDRSIDRSSGRVAFSHVRVTFPDLSSKHVVCVK